MAVQPGTGLGSVGSVVGARVESAVQVGRVYSSVNACGARSRVLRCVGVNVNTTDACGVVWVWDFVSFRLCER